ncbi:DUF7344 domain-containing protein [Candidatus Halobonum tyrrellensis]|uniref:DUF7344 domain-containing protein n=1 Tax=Candidatus Halobonum tyrrellensis G22 TaxID=1324957 RepID=V4HGG2_9EURY|nr:hypothetical protein [Candidatus Halobonum tyrrellensis]ESP86889.1 hypothetical protein K933_16547 [Candidatus Halobonum tyrrellensis G22]
MTETSLSTADDAPSDSTASNGGAELAESTGQGELDVGAEGEQGDVNAPEPLTTNDIHSLLKNQRRRYVLEYLRDNDEPVRLRDVAEQIAAWENDKELKTITSSERKRAYVGLYQCHLPKMDDADVVSFDQNRGDIEIGPNADQLMSYLTDDEETEETDAAVHSWADRYLAVSGAALLVTVVVAAGFGASGVGVALAALTSLSVGALSLAEKRSLAADDGDDETAA